MDMYTLHGVADWGSQVIHLALAELGQPYKFKAMDWDAGDFSAPAFLALNPFGRVPVLETPDGPVFETLAILLYLSERHNTLAPAPGTPGRPEFLTALVLITNSVHPGAMALIHPERPGGEAAQEAVSTATHARLRQEMGYLNDLAAAGKGGLSADEVTISGLYLAMLMRWMAAFAVYPQHAIKPADYPALVALLRGLEARPAVQAVLAAEGLPADAFSGARPE
jgi:glutathione S-transferase